MHSAPSYKIILGVTGGIAAYKACELARNFIKAGHEVRVVMTAHAEQFVGALTFHSLTGYPVLRSLAQGTSDLSATSHIDLARWGDLFVIAPATANFLAKARAGMADDALLTELLAFQGPVLLAPAMNTRMWDAPVTRENFSVLLERGYHSVDPVEGLLACGEEGAGKMAEPAQIFARAITLLQDSTAKPLAGKTVLITSGPTRNYIDSIRFISNRSSGRMGHAVATAASALGAKVIFVSGPVEERFQKSPTGKSIAVETGDQMLAAALDAFDEADFVVATAAVADFAPHEVSEGKIRREGTLDLQLRASTDVLAELGRRKRSNQVFVGFAAEVGESEVEFKKAREKLEKKNLDLLAFNNVSRKDIGFDVEQNEILLFSKIAEPVPLAKAKKEVLAREILLRANELQGKMS